MRFLLLFSILPPFYSIVNEDYLFSLLFAKLIPSWNHFVLEIPSHGINDLEELWAWFWNFSVRIHHQVFCVSFTTAKQAQNFIHSRLCLCVSMWMRSLFRLSKKKKKCCSSWLTFIQFIEWIIDLQPEEKVKLLTQGSNSIKCIAST